MPTDQNPLIYVSKIQDLVDLEEYMQDPEQQRAMDMAVKYIYAPEQLPDPKRVAVTITQLSAFSVVFRMKYVEYMTWKKGTKDAAYYKNCYRSMYEGLDNLVDSMKYLAKQ